MKRWKCAQLKDLLMVMYMHWSSFCIVYSVLFFFLVSLYKNVLVLIVVNECLNLFLFLGFCTEFNVAGGVIQSHPLAPCNKMTFPKCNIHYYSSEAYKCKIPYLYFLIIYLTLVSRFFFTLPTCENYSGEHMPSVFARRCASTINISPF